MSMTASPSRRRFRPLLAGLALLGTLLLGYYQRRTGPTWPLAVALELDGSRVEGRLPRTHAGDGDARLALAAPDEEISGEVLWRRFPTDDPWSRLPLERRGAELTASLPHQPAAAKLEYSLLLRRPGGAPVAIPERAAVIRFRGGVPAAVLVPHILAMFAALALSLRAALGALVGEPRVARFVPWLLAVLLLGGFLLGPLVQKYAFDAWWTGWPLGGDWTDNKTLAALVAWITAFILGRRSERAARVAVLLAAAVMLAVYSIPHSIHGSELDWSTVESGAADPGSPETATETGAWRPE